MNMSWGPQNSRLIPADWLHGTAGTMEKSEQTASTILEPIISGYLFATPSDEFFLGRSERLIPQNRKIFPGDQTQLKPKPRKSGHVHGASIVQ